MPLFGTMPFKNRKWAPGVKLSGLESPAEEWVTDPNLVPLGVDPRFPTADFVVIPRGRMIGVRADNYTYEGRAILSIADGVDPDNRPPGYLGGIKPAGFTEANIFRQWSEHIQSMPVLDKRAYVEVPYVPTINNAYGVLKSGDKLTGYFGTVSNTYGDQMQRGALVKWVERTLYALHVAASAMVNLPNTPYPAFVPRVVWAASGTGIYTGAAPVITYNTTLNTWSASFASAVTDIWFTYGQSVDQIGGEVGKIEPLSATHQFDGWLQWVTDDFRMWEYPPMYLRVPSTTVTNEAPVFWATGYYKLANGPLVPHLSITVTLAPSGTNTFTVTDENGNQTVVTSGSPLTLPISDIPFVDYTLGKYYNINPITKELFLSTNITYSGGAVGAGSTFNQIQVSYSYETSYRDGRLYNQGIIGLTDGLGGSGFPGTPANLDIIGSAGALRAMIY